MNDDLEKLSNYKRNLEIYHSQIKKDEISKITQNIEKMQDTNCLKKDRQVMVLFLLPVAKMKQMI